MSALVWKVTIFIYGCLAFSQSIWAQNEPLLSKPAASHESRILREAPAVSGSLLEPAPLFSIEIEKALLDSEDPQKELARMLDEGMNYKLQPASAFSTEFMAYLYQMLAGYPNPYRLPITLSVGEIDQEKLRLEERDGKLHAVIPWKTALSRDPSDFLKELIDAIEKESYQNKELHGVPYTYVNEKYLANYFQEVLGLALGENASQKALDNAPDHIDEITNQDLQQLDELMRYIPTFYFTETSPANGRKFKNPPPRIKLDNVVKVTSTQNKLGFHYDEESKTLYFSDAIFNSDPLAAKAEDAFDGDGIGRNERFHQFMGAIIWDSLPKQWQAGYASFSWKKAEDGALQLKDEVRLPYASTHLGGPQMDFADHFAAVINRPERIDNILPEFSPNLELNAKRDFLFEGVFNGYSFNRYSFGQYEVEVVGGTDDAIAPRWEAGKVQVLTEEAGDEHNLVMFKIDGIEEPNLPDGTKGEGLHSAELYFESILGRNINVKPFSVDVDLNKASEDGSYKAALLTPHSEVFAGPYAVTAVSLRDKAGNKSHYKLSFPSTTGDGQWSRISVGGANRSQVVVLPGTRQDRLRQAKEEADFEFPFEDLSWKEVKRLDNGRLVEVTIPFDLKKIEEEGVGFTLEFRGKKTLETMKWEVSNTSKDKPELKVTRNEDGSSTYVVYVSDHEFASDQFELRRAHFDKGRGSDRARVEFSASRDQQERLTYDHTGSRLAELPLEVDVEAGKMEVRYGEDQAGLKEGDKTNKFGGNATLAFQIPIPEDAADLDAAGFRIAAHAKVLAPDGSYIPGYIDVKKHRLTKDKDGKRYLTLEAPLTRRYKNGTYKGVELEYLVLPPRMRQEELDEIKKANASHANQDFRRRKKIALSGIQVTINSDAITEEPEKRELPKLEFREEILD